MRRKKWRGTLLFAAILTVLGLTVGLRLYASGQAASSAISVSAPPTTAPATAAPAGPPATSSAAAPAAPAASTRTVTGDTEQTPYGPLQVQVTYTGTRITAITELQTPSEGRRSVEINAQAGPMLTQEALSSQSAKIDSISGATYTSQGYIQSLQSAIDKG